MRLPEPCVARQRSPGQVAAIDAAQQFLAKQLMEILKVHRCLDVNHSILHDYCNQNKLLICNLISALSPYI